MLTDEKYLAKLGKRIETLSRDKFETQSKFSDECNVDTRTIRRIIKSEQNPSILVLRKIAISLDITLIELLDF